MNKIIVILMIVCVTMFVFLDIVQRKTNLIWLSDVKFIIIFIVAMIAIFNILKCKK
ncbi:hypothetical protein [Clostridium sp.]|jgi:hypothetical protein|uniref:hypothetical protein n=1 Tax=Clostridium sp. TaxID=1506 RepID=UPI003EEDB6BD